MTGKKSNRRESERVLAWRFFCEQKKEEVLNFIKNAFCAIVVIVVIVCYVFVNLTITLFILGPVPGGETGCGGLSSGSCSTGHSLFVVGLIASQLVVSRWFWINWSRAKKRARKEFRGNRK